MIKKPITLAIGCVALALAAGTSALPAQAESASRTWVGPNGGVVHWHGQGEAGRYRGTVVVETPDGRTYRRVTTIRRGPNGAYASRKWIGPNGGVAYRAGGVRY
jgi:hypothetical protein